MNKITKLVSHNTAFRGEDARVEIVKFLREYADMIESKKETAHKAVLILCEEVSEGDKIRIYSRRCNVSTWLEHAGLMQLALHDVCEISK